MQTYRHGDGLEVKDTITKDDVAGACEEIMQKYESTFGGRWVIEPEPITEGGFVFTEFPGKRGDMYKTYRLRLPYTARPRWPRVSAAPGERTQAWKGKRGADDVLFTPTNELRRDAMGRWRRVGPRREAALGDSFLKAFYGAPRWTRQEQDIFAEALENIGFVIRGRRRRNRL